jgi:hypothetical protein
MEGILTGAITFASFAVGLFFLRFWKSTQDRFFLYFALSFWIQGMNRIHIWVEGVASEDSAVIYLIRLLAYVMILVAIWEKNREPRKVTSRNEASPALSEHKVPRHD